ncbi:hypothetical protein CFAM422_002183 [Trichoderma lentiforme]|uniref:Uncharacterized protein n=1 Tax=Trichoderma lentiforme TaxID=1567552 RepID=A0A9P4XLY0_9HYPO|nr:hypothetical protein CFAM422_002183 [Trichoderma lentiforme]
MRKKVVFMHFTVNKLWHQPHKNQFQGAIHQVFVAVLVPDNIEETLELIQDPLVIVLVDRGRRRSRIIARAKQPAQAPMPTAKVHAGHACREQVRDSAGGPTAQSEQLPLRLGSHKSGRAGAVVRKQGASERPKDGW